MNWNSFDERRETNCVRKSKTENINSYLFHRTDIPNLQFNFTVQLPKLTFNGKYSLKMRLLLLNIQGKGPISGVLGNYMKLIHKC